MKPRSSGNGDTDGVFLNYTRVMEVSDDKFNLSPRKDFWSKLSSDQQQIKRYSIGEDEYL